MKLLEYLNWKIKLVIIKTIESLIWLIGDVEKKIYIIYLFAKFYSTRFVGVYSDCFLEKQLQRIGKSIKVDLSNNINKDTVLHIMTEAYEVGGHSRVVENWIRFDNKRTHSVLFTDGKKAKKTLPGFLKEIVEVSGGKIYFLHQNTYIDKTKKLLSIASAFDKVVLHTHMWDPLPVLAFSNLKWENTIYLFNHANYRFWLGASIADVSLEITEFDKNTSIECRGIKRCIRLDIPIFLDEKKDDIKNLDYRAKFEICDDEIVITSMGAKDKFLPTQDISFFDFATKLLDKNSKIVLFVIGPNLSDNNWKKIKKKYGRRINVTGKIDRYEVDKILSFTDLYVNSMPIGSATACLDASVRGIKVVGIYREGQCLDCHNNKDITSVDKMIEYINWILCNEDCIEADDISMHLKTKWIKKLEKIYEYTPKHRIHKFYPRNRYSNYEKMISIVYKDFGSDVSKELGIWHYIFKFMKKYFGIN